ncbi:hypothetical protein RyT2_14820 [Pseudolactococcus yaeyamensis]
MKTLGFIQRILATLIDLIIVYVPLVLLVNIMFSEMGSLANIFPAILFIVYNIVAVNSFKGQTIGKYFAKLRVKNESISLMADSVREAVKILYFLPFAGFAFILLSCAIYVRKGKFLHDIIGKSEVILHG